MKTSQKTGGLPPALRHLRGFGDVVHAVAQPVARAIDAVAKTNLQGCGGCAGRREKLNETFPMKKLLPLILLLALAGRLSAQTVTNLTVGVQTNATQIFSVINANNNAIVYRLNDHMTNLGTLNTNIAMTVRTNGNTANGQIPYATNTAPGYFWASAPTGGGGGGGGAAVLWNWTTAGMYPNGNTGTGGGWTTTNSAIYPQ